MCKVVIQKRRGSSQGQSKFISDTLMASARLRFEDRLDGAINFSPWKERITVLFKELEVWDILDASDTIIIPSNTTQKVAFENKDIKAQRIFLDSIKGHVSW